MGRETSIALKALFERVQTWPEADQEEALRLFEDIEAQFYEPLSDEDMAAVERGLDDVRHGRTVGMEEIRALFDQYREK